MNALIFWFGSAVVGIVGLYGVLFVLYMVLGLSERAAIPVKAMPKLRPIPIPTKHQDTWLHKVLAFVFDVRRWQLAETWRFELDKGEVLVLHGGFEFDGASIPRPFWAVLSPTGLLLIPGLIHDYGYKYDQIWKLDEDGQPSPYWHGAGKAHWDKLFLRVAREVNGMLILNVIAWMAVTFGGSGSWNKHRQKGDVPLEPVMPDNQGA